MCGIFGWSLADGKLSNTKRKTLYDVLAVQNDTRGGDSYGVYCFDKRTNAPTVEQGLGDMYSARYSKAIPWKANVMFAHTRFATHGSKTEENAHPFRVGSVIGAHNGVLSNHEELNILHRRKFAVDSQHLFAHLDDGTDMADIEGYGAIEYVRDSDPKAVYVGIFDHSLAMYRLDGGMGVFWTSSSEHGKMAMKLTHLTGVRLELDDRKVYEIVDGEAYKTTGCLNVSKASSKWDWRDGNYGYGQSGILYRYGQKTTSYARAYLGTGDSDDYPDDGQPADTEAGTNKPKKYLAGSNGDLPPMGEEFEGFEDIYCDKCYLHHEECECDKADGMMECPECDGAGMIEGPTPKDDTECLMCEGKGEFPEVEEYPDSPDDPAFAVSDGFMDRLPAHYRNAKESD